MVCDQLILKDAFPPSLLFPIGEFPGQKKKKLLVPTFMALNFAYLNLIQISEVFQYSFITSWSFCPHAISKFHLNALFIYAKAMNSNMKQDKDPKWPTLVIPFPYQDSVFVEQTQRPFKNLNISD